MRPREHAAPSNAAKARLQTPRLPRLACVNALATIAAIPLEAHRRAAERDVLGQYGQALTHEEYLELTRGELIKSLRISDDAHRCSKAVFCLARLGAELGRPRRASWNS